MQMKKTSKEKQKKIYCFSNTHSNFEIFHIFGLQNPERMKTEEA